MITAANIRAIVFAGCLLFAFAPDTQAATLYVDSNRNEDPSINRFTSISRAVSKLQPGDTILIANGTYRETIDLRQAGLATARPLSMPTTIAAAPGAKATIKGSDVVTGWQRVAADTYAKQNWTHNSQQVFINGNPLKQIGGAVYGDFPLNPKHAMANLHRSQGGIWPGRVGNNRSDLSPESFYYDLEAQTLYVRTGLDIARGQQVEVSTRPYLVIGTGIAQLDLRGLRFAHANTTSVSQSGAITLSGNQLALEDIVVEHVDGAGIDITGDDNVVFRSTANHCGIVGLKVRGHRARIADNETSFNNTRGFNKWWEAGGAKFVGAGGLQDSEVSGNRAYENQGDGLWFDWRNNNNRIHHNVTAHNTGMGIHYEASQRAFIYDNYSYGNGQRGIYLPNSSHSVIAHNLVAANGMEGIVVVNDREAAPDSELSPTNNAVVGNVIAWNSKSALVLPVTTSDNRSDANLFIDADTPTFSSGWPTRERPIARGLDAWRGVSGQDASSQAARTAMQPTLKKLLDAHERFSDKSYVTWESLSELTDQKIPTIAGVNNEFSRPGSAPGPKRERTP